MTDLIKKFCKKFSVLGLENILHIDKEKLKKSISQFSFN